MPKKILIFSLAYFPHVGGAEIAVKEITDRISPDDFLFDMVTQKFNSTNPSFERIGNINIYRIGSSNTVFQKLFFPFRAFMKARSLHHKNHYDLVFHADLDFRLTALPLRQCFVYPLFVRIRQSLLL